MKSWKTLLLISTLPMGAVLQEDTKSVLTVSGTLKREEEKLVNIAKLRDKLGTRLKPRWRWTRQTIITTTKLEEMREEESIRQSHQR